MVEEWKSLKGVVQNGDNYAVSTLGRVKNVKTGRVLKCSKDGAGYIGVKLCLNGGKKDYRVHQLVALAFIPQVKGNTEVNHINGNKADNTLNNLEWSNRIAQAKHAIKTGLLPIAKPVEQLTLDGELVKVFNSIKDVYKDGFNRDAVSLVCRGKRKSYGGYVWRYSNNNKTG